jgi:DNA excision repair protein ERCC-2
LPIITNGLTTKGLEIPKEMTEKYIKNICDFVSVVSNALVFTSSYRVQESLLDCGLADKIKDKNLFIETSEMRGEEGKKIIKSFNEGEGNVLIAPIGGRFSEGIDCPGRINGIYIVGIPFDKVCAKTNAYLNYYINIYGQARGRLYGYILPAMKRAAQAIGRGLRDEKDRCVVVLGDERYSTQKLFKLLPDYVRENALITYPKSVQRLAEKFNTAADFNR